VSNKLFWKLSLFVAVIQPKVFLFENVEGLLHDRNLGILLEQKRRLNMLNYEWGYTTFNAEEYEVPQERRRVIFVGIRKDVYEKSSKGSFFPTPNLDDLDGLSISSVLPNLIGCSPGQFKDDFRFGNRPFCTVTKGTSLWVYDKQADRRRPTIAELMVASSFPVNFKLDGPKGEQWGRIGNAVPPKLIRAFARTINENFLNPYLTSNNHTKAEYEKLKIISNHFKQHGFKVVKDVKLPF
ncbi:MAG TPA: DNA cytosine methyltransferase, partial [Bacteroidia bacterium]|nr:DNA cytosine methyltransferase [Bacteroidia bacterium]